MGDFAQDRLAAGNHEFQPLRNLSRGANDVSQLFTCHCGSSVTNMRPFFNVRTSASNFIRVSSGRSTIRGEACRNCAPVWLLDKTLRQFLSSRIWRHFFSNGSDRLGRWWLAAIC
ncbi:hypothetical protein D3C85_1440890 [compost metagenome]